MKQYLHLLAIIFFVPLSIHSQKVEIKGTIKDSSSRPLSYANIIAKRKNISKSLQFAISDDEGFYRLSFRKGDTIAITVSYMGYISINFDFVANQNTIKNIILKESSEQLDEVIIELPVAVRGDTTIYKTDKFTTGEERKLKNVLKKLPGVEVNKNGTVTVQGKKVTKMLVDGKNFFDGNSKLAVNNIPADAVDKVEVIDNYNEVTFLKNISDSDEMAMNVKLKADKKRFVFGDVEVGKGNSEFYKTHANLFYYSPKTNVNFIGNLNNIAEKTFTFKDYLNFQGGFNAVFSGDFDFKGGDFSKFLANRDVLKSTQRFGALNITKTASRALDVSGYLVVSHTKEGNLTETRNDYSTFNELRENNTELDNLLGIGKLNLEYTPNKEERLYARTQVKRTNNINNNVILSIINGHRDVISTNRDLTGVSLNQNIEWHNKLTDKQTYSAVINYDFRSNDQHTFWRTEDNILQGLIPITSGQNLLRLRQIKDMKSHSFDAIFKHFWEVNNSNHIYTTLGNKYRKEHFDTSDSQELDNGSVNDFSMDDFGNDVSFILNDFFLALHYKFRAGIFTVKQGVHCHKYTWEIYQQNIRSRHKWVVLPDFMMKINFSRSKKIHVNYRLKTTFTDVSKLANRFYLESYNSVFRGNASLQNTLFHSAMIYYSRFSLYRGLMVNASLNYDKQIRGIRNTVQFEGVNQFLTNRMFMNPSQTISLRTSIHKTIKKIKYKLNLNGSQSDYLQEIDGAIENNSNDNYSYTFGLETIYSNFPNIEVGFKRSTGIFNSSSSTSKFRTNEPYLSVNYDFLKGFILSFDYKLYDFKNKASNQSNKFDVANFILSYRKENHAWTYKLFSNNLFNARFKRNSSFSQYLISDTKTFILPRLIMLGIGYNL